MQEILNKFSEVASNPYESILQYKETTGKEVIGCFPMDIPEEIIHAAGMLPVVMWRSNEPVTWGHAHVMPYNCAITRSFVDDAVKGKLAFMDGMIFSRQCLQVQDLPFIIQRNLPPLYVDLLYLPSISPETHEPARDFTIEELTRMKKGIEELKREKITVEALNRSFEVYNKNRALLRRLYELRRKNPALIRSGDISMIVNSSMLMPKEEHNDLLERALSELEKRQVPTDESKKVIIIGCLCQAAPLDVVELIESLGMRVVDDDIYVGARYLANDVETSEEPIKALAERYMRREPPTLTKADWENDWSDHVTDMARRNDAVGVISLLVKFCPPHLAYYPHLKKRLAKEDIPELLVEMEHEVVSLSGIRTRLEAFAESIG